MPIPLLLLVACSLGAPFLTAASQRITWDDVLGQPHAWYRTAEARRIAENVLLYQRQSGGWPKNIEMTRVLTPAERQQVVEAQKEPDSTIDNGATWRQLRYLARVVNVTGDVRFRESFFRGIDFLFAAEHEKGGWPQIYPLRKDYSRHITFNDGATINVASLLRDVVAGGDFAFVDAERRARASRSVDRTIAMILAAQIRVNGRLTVWCAQHDAQTLEPRPARIYEPVSLSGMESAGILRFIMDIPRPDAAVVGAIEAGVEWFRTVRLDGIRVERVPAPERTPNFDLKVVSDASAPSLWARFYEIGTNRPMFAGRDGIVKYELAAIDHERRTGYDWLGPYAAALVAREYPAWKSRLKSRPA